MSRPVLLAGNFLSHHGISLSPIEELAVRLREEGVPVLCASRQRNGFLRGLDLMATALRYRSTYEFGVVDLYSGRAFLWGEALTLLLKVLRRRFVLCLHGGGLPDFARQYPRRVRACLRRADVVTAPSSFIVERMREFRPNIQLLPNALDLSAYQFRQRSFLGSYRLVWLRTFHSIYNPSLAPRVVAELKRTFPAVSLLMVGKDWGDGSLQRTQQIAEELGVAESVSYLGPIPKTQVPMILQQGDIFLNTTNVDNTPVSIIEAMACGLCVVSTNVGGIPYLLEHEKDALLVPPDDPEAMAAATAQILTDPALAARLSVSGRSKAETFDWPAIIPLWKNLLAPEHSLAAVA